MKRDMDLIREILLEIETGTIQFCTLTKHEANILQVNDSELCESDAKASKLAYHLELLENASLIECNNTSEFWRIRNITWNGHDFLDSIRDPEIWQRTKEGALSAGGFTIDLLKDLAKGYLKKRISEKTGIPL